MDRMTKTTHEIGWLIERHFNSVLHYWEGRIAHTGESAHGWTTDANKAIRFARSDDASVALGWLLDGVGRVVQHAWPQEG